MKNIIAEQFGKNIRFGDISAVNLYRRLPNVVREWAVYFLALFRSRKSNRKRFLIFAQGRTGSTLLVDLLNSHPEIFSYGEIFDRRVIRNVRFPVRFAMGLEALCRKPVCGFKVKIYQFVGHQNRDPAVELRNFNRRGWRIIYLRRNNLFLHAISDIRSELTKTWHKRKDSLDAPPTKIRIEFDEIVEAMDYREQKLVEENECLAGIEYLPITYETDLQDAGKQSALSDKILPYIGLEPCVLETRLRKVNSGTPKDLIENYDELIGQIRETRFAEFLPS